MESSSSQSLIVTKSEFDLFEGSHFQTSVDTSQYVTIYPTTGITANGCEFVISSSRDYYIDVSQTLLHVRGKIVQENGNNITEAAGVYPVNLFGPSLWNNVEVFYNNELVSSANSMFPTKCYIETLLNFGISAKTSHLSAALYFKDSHPDLHVIADIKKKKANDGAVRRHALCAKSKTLDMIHPLNVDVFKTNKLLLNQVEVRIRLTRSKDAFVLMAKDNTANYIFKIESCTLLARLVKPSEATATAIEKVLQSNNHATYNINRVLMRNFTIPTGTTTVVKDNLLNSLVPKRLALAFISNEAFSGNFILNPHYYSDCGVSTVMLNVNGRDVFPLKVDFNHGHFVKAFYSQFLALGFKNQQDFGTDVTIEDFQKNFILVFDLTPDHSSETSLRFINNLGNLRLSLSFSPALEEALTCLLYCETDGTLMISDNRRIIRDYT